MTITAKILIRGIALSGLTSLLLGCATQQTDVASPTAQATLAVEDVQSIPIQRPLSPKSSTSTVEQCRRVDARYQCVQVDRGRLRDQLRNRFDDMGQYYPDW